MGSATFQSGLSFYSLDGDESAPRMVGVPTASRKYGLPGPTRISQAVHNQIDPRSFESRGCYTNRRNDLRTIVVHSGLLSWEENIATNYYLSGYPPTFSILLTA